MRRFLAIMLAVMTLAIPAFARAAEDAPLTVISTIFPGYDFVRAIAGDRVDNVLLIKPGAESHGFEPTPRDIISIQRCDVFICVGGESDAWVDTLLRSIDAPEMTVLKMMDMVETVEEEYTPGMEQEAHDHDGHDHDEHEHGAELDEHVWTSPLNAIGIAQSIADALIARDPQNADAYRANMAAYAEELTALDGRFRSVVESAQTDTLIFGDRFPFRYLVDEYGLRYYAAFPGCASQSEASAKTVAFLIEKVKAEHIPAVFTIEFSNGRMADTICRATGATKLMMHSCHNLSSADFDAGETYLTLMDKNVQALAVALAS